LVELDPRPHDPLSRPPQGFEPMTHDILLAKTFIDSVMFYASSNQALESMAG